MARFLRLDVLNEIVKPPGTWVLRDFHSPEEGFGSREYRSHIRNGSDRDAGNKQNAVPCAGYRVP